MDKRMENEMETTIIYSNKSSRYGSSGGGRGGIHVYIAV